MRGPSPRGGTGLIGPESNGKGMGGWDDQAGRREKRAVVTSVGGR